MSDQNPYRPAVDVEDAEHATNHARWFHRLAGLSSAAGTLLVGLPILQILMGSSGRIRPIEWFSLFLLVFTGSSLIVAGYYWYARDVRPAIGWTVAGFGVLGAMMLLLS